jgi:hypothetical protein
LVLKGPASTECNVVIVKAGLAIWSYKGN